MWMCRCMQVYPVQEIHHVHRDERSPWSQEKKVLSRQAARGRSSRTWASENPNGMDSRFKQRSTSHAKWLCGESRMGDGWRSSRSLITPLRIEQSNFAYQMINWVVRWFVNRSWIASDIHRQWILIRNQEMKEWKGKSKEILTTTRKIRPIGQK